MISSAILRSAIRTHLVRAACLWLWSVAVAHAGTIGVYTSDDKGFDTHTFYYDDGKEVVLFDTQFVPPRVRIVVASIDQPRGRR